MASSAFLLSVCRQDMNFQTTSDQAIQRSGHPDIQRSGNPEIKG